MDTRAEQGTPTKVQPNEVAWDRYSCPNRSTECNNHLSRKGMCGRIAQIDTPDELAELMGITDGLESLDHVQTAYNVPPSSKLASLVAGAERGIKWVPLEWGMRPSWMKSKRAMINARCETVNQRPMFKRSFASRRCVIPATAYYEWLLGPRGKQPYCIRTSSREPLLLAGLYAGGQCVILTRAARDDLAFIHDRMPVAMPREWISPYLQDLTAAFASFTAADALDLVYYPVTRRVGSPRFNTPECLEPIDD